MLFNLALAKKFTRQITANLQQTVADFFFGLRVCNSIQSCNTVVFKKKQIFQVCETDCLFQFFQVASNSRHGLCIKYNYIAVV